MIYFSQFFTEVCGGVCGCGVCGVCGGGCVGVWVGWVCVGGWVCVKTLTKMFKKTTFLVKDLLLLALSKKDFQTDYIRLK